MVGSGRRWGAVLAGALTASVLVAVPTPPGARAATTDRVSAGGEWMESRNPSVSADGRYVAFESYADNLVAGDTNSSPDIFVHDRTAWTTTRVSVASDGTEANFGGRDPQISADAATVVFVSDADNLVAGDTNYATDVFVHHIATGVTERASLDASGTEAAGAATLPSVSADGSRVAFLSAASLTAADGDYGDDVYVRDLAVGTLALASVDAAGANIDAWVTAPAMSGDGNVVAFATNADLDPGDANYQLDLYARDLAAGTTEWVSAGNTCGAPGDDASASLSADGRFVAFDVSSCSLDATPEPGIWVRDRAGGTTERVSVSAAGVGATGNPYDTPTISADGRFVGFSSADDRLVTGDANGVEDVFLHDRDSGDTVRVSVRGDGTEADGPSGAPAVSGDGNVVAFHSYATNLVDDDANSAADVFVHDRTGTGSSTEVDMGASGEQGRPPYGVDFDASGIDTGGRPIVLWHWDFGDGETADGSPTATHTFTRAGVFAVFVRAVDDLGNVFLGRRTVTVADTDPPVPRITLRPSSGPPPLEVAFDGTGSTDDGTVVSWRWDPGDGSSYVDGDTATHTYTDPGVYTVGLSVTDNEGFHASATASVVVAEGIPTAAFTVTPPRGGAPLDVDFDASASADSDGTITSYLWDFGDGETGEGVTPAHTYDTDGVYEARLTVTDDAGLSGVASQYVVVAPDGGTELVSAAPDGAGGDGTSHGGSVSADGRYVVFHSYSRNLLDVEGGGSPGIYVRDREAGTTSLVVADTAELETGWPQISADGSTIVFYGGSDPGDSDGIYAVARGDGAPRRVSESFDGRPGDIIVTGASSDGFDVSADGRYVVFRAYQWILEPPGGSGCSADTRAGISPHDYETHNTYAIPYAEALVRKDVATGAVQRVDVHTITLPGGGDCVTGAGSDGLHGMADSRAPRVSGDGNIVAYTGGSVESAVPNLAWCWRSDAYTSHGEWFHHVIVHDMASNTNTAIVDPEVAAWEPPPDPGTYCDSYLRFDQVGPDVSTDGRYVAWGRRGRSPEGPYSLGVRIHDRTTGVTTPVTAGPFTDFLGEVAGFAQEGSLLALSAFAPDAGEASVHIRDAADPDVSVMSAVGGAVPAYFGGLSGATSRVLGYQSNGVYPELDRNGEPETPLWAWNGQDVWALQVPDPGGGGGGGGDDDTEFVALRAGGNVTWGAGDTARAGRVTAVLHRETATSPPEGTATFETSTRTRTWRVVQETWASLAAAEGEPVVATGPCDLYSLPKALPLALDFLADRRQGVCEWRFTDGGSVALSVARPGGGGPYLDVPASALGGEGGAPGVAVHMVGPEEFQDPTQAMWDKIRTPILGAVRPLRASVAGGFDRVTTNVHEARDGLVAGVDRASVDLSRSLGNAVESGVVGALRLWRLGLAGTAGPPLGTTDPSAPDANSLPSLRTWLTVQLQGAAHRFFVEPVAAAADVIFLGDWVRDTLGPWADAKLASLVDGVFAPLDAYFAHVEDTVAALPDDAAFSEKLAALMNILYGDLAGGGDDPTVFGIDDLARAVEAVRVGFHTEWTAFWADLPYSALDVLAGDVTDNVPEALHGIFDFVFGSREAWTDAATLSEFGIRLIDAATGRLNAWIHSMDMWVANTAAGLAVDAVPVSPLVDGVLGAIGGAAGLDLPTSAEIRDGVRDVLTGDPADPGDDAREAETVREKVTRATAAFDAFLETDVFGTIREAVLAIFASVDDKVTMLRDLLVAPLDRAIAFLEGPPPPALDALVRAAISALSSSFAAFGSPLGGALAAVLSAEAPRYLDRGCADGWSLLADVSCLVGKLLPEWVRLARLAFESKVPLAGDDVPPVAVAGRGTNVFGLGKLDVPTGPGVDTASVGVWLTRRGGEPPRGSAMLVYRSGDVQGAITSTGWTSADVTAADGTIEEIDGDGAELSASGPCRAYRFYVGGLIRAPLEGERTCTWRFGPAGAVGLQVAGDVPGWVDLAPAPLSGGAGGAMVSAFPPLLSAFDLADPVLAGLPVVLADWGPLVLFPGWSPMTVLPGLRDGLPGTEFTFRAAAVAGPRGDPVEAFEWDFDGDGSADTTTSEGTATHTYGSVVTVVPMVRVRDTRGRTSPWMPALGALWSTLETRATPPLTYLAWSPGVGRPSTDFEFRAKFRHIDAALGAKVVTVQWDFDGDGDAERTESVAPSGDGTATTSLAYLHTGSYHPRVRVIDDFGTPSPWAGGLALVVATVAPEGELASWEPCAQRFICGGGTPDGDTTTEFTLTARFRDPDEGLGGRVTVAHWDFDGDGTTDAVVPVAPAGHGTATATHTFSAPGAYTPRVRFEDNDGRLGAWETRTLLGSPVTLDVA